MFGFPLQQTALTLPPSLPLFLSLSTPRNTDRTGRNEYGALARQRPPSDPATVRVFGLSMRANDTPVPVHVIVQARLIPAMVQGSLAPGRDWQGWLLACGLYEETARIAGTQHRPRRWRRDCDAPAIPVPGITG